jgi:hypothetical protein
VPRAEQTYDYLAALAASKLITRYPAHLFHDNGSRTHQTEEDITFSRAQIADLIREAITNADAEGEDKISGKQSAALGALVARYQPELQKLGVAQTRIDALMKGRKRFEIAYSGQSRASLISGSARNPSGVGGGGNGIVTSRDAQDPFSEPRGGQRTRSGFDSRNNIFGHVGDNLRFFAQVDSGTDSRRGAKDGGFQINEAYFDLDANKKIRGLNLRVGRDTPWWGPGHFGTLLLSDLSGPLNTIQSTFKRGSYQLDGLYAPLSRGPLGGQRSLYGHNLQLKIGPQTRIGFAETLLLPRNSLDPLSFVAAFSPIPLFAIERARGRNTAADNGNSLVQAYVETSIARGLRTWGEVLVDDIGVNQNNLVRNRIGALVGFHAFTPDDPARLGFFAEYANLNGRTYLGLQSLSDGDYYNRNAPLGYPVAPPQGIGAGGAESLRFEGYWRALPKLRIGAGVEFADLGAEQNNSSRQQIYRFRAAYDLSRTITLIARARRVSTDRPNFTPGAAPLTRNLLQFEVARAF